MLAYSNEMPVEVLDGPEFYWYLIQVQHVNN
jgi:hypothetical protein